MSFLGDVGSLYMLFLIALLVFGLGMLAKGFLEYIFNFGSRHIAKNKGRGALQNGYWLKLSFLSLMGIVVSLIILSLLSSYGFMGHSA